LRRANTRHPHGEGRSHKRILRRRGSAACTALGPRRLAGFGVDYRGWGVVCLRQLSIARHSDCSRAKGRTSLRLSRDPRNPVDDGNYGNDALSVALFPRGTLVFEPGGSGFVDEHSATGIAGCDPKPELPSIASLLITAPAYPGLYRVSFVDPAAGTAPAKDDLFVQAPGRKRALAA
jgi:hypothetical protein